MYPLSLESSAGFINSANRALESALHSAVKYAIDIGDKLIEVKEALPHGEFQGWCDENIKVARIQRQAYIKLASNSQRDDLLEQPSIRQALDFIKPKHEPKPIRDDGLVGNAAAERLSSMSEEWKQGFRANFAFSMRQSTLSVGIAEIPSSLIPVNNPEFEVALVRLLVRFNHPDMGGTDDQSKAINLIYNKIKKDSK